MRRAAGFIVAMVVGAGLLVVPPRPAGAHFCSSPLKVPVGEPVTFTVGVPAEEAQVGRVEIEVPEEFDLHRPVERPPWRVEQEGDKVIFTGGPINLFQCGFFTLAGEVPDKAKLVVPFTTYDTQGKKIREFRSEDLSHLDTAQLVYAGVDFEGRPTEPGEGPPPWLQPVGWGLIGVAVIGGGVLLLRRRNEAG
jgi:uncharacterized protein YcnI